MFSKDIKRYATAVVYDAPAKSLEKSCFDMQNQGPSWSGKFSNSWEIKGMGQVLAKGNGQASDPKRLKLPKKSIDEVFSVVKKKNSVKFSIYNTSPYGFLRSLFSSSKCSVQSAPKQAIDKQADFFRRPTDKPLTNLGKRKFQDFLGRRNGKTLRGQPISGRTAKLDWFTNYKKGGPFQSTFNKNFNTETKKTFL